MTSTPDASGPTPRSPSTAAKVTAPLDDVRVRSRRIGSGGPPFPNNMAEKVKPGSSTNRTRARAPADPRDAPDEPLVELHGAALDEPRAAVGLCRERGAPIGGSVAVGEEPDRFPVGWRRSRPRRRRAGPACARSPGEGGRRECWDPPRRRVPALQTQLHDSDPEADRRVHIVGIGGGGHLDLDPLAQRALLRRRGRASSSPRAGDDDPRALLLDRPRADANAAMPRKVDGGPVLLLLATTPANVSPRVTACPAITPSASPRLIS